ncbi:TBC1 domain family member 17 [Olea europaea subsp. europaea]|uniref:TBC1 domain family member 17 n=1 Tax=Olea europaea subsp. europaea TaxID=158383 RepID=A0A8S0QTT9_OLEEU|nr:TBC1 domain family member 17 [Olea europaea subsp. europaea]
MQMLVKYLSLLLREMMLSIVLKRTLVFYERQKNLSKLWNILSVYAWFDKDVGYCQGMSDLCSPMIMLLEEADAFWCFEQLRNPWWRRLSVCFQNAYGVVSLRILFWGFIIPLGDDVGPGV